MPPEQVTKITFIKLYLNKIIADGTPSFTKKKIQATKTVIILRKSSINQNTNQILIYLSNLAILKQKNRAWAY